MNIFVGHLTLLVCSEVLKQGTERSAVDYMLPFYF